MERLIKFFINRTLLVGLITLFVLLAGFISLNTINRESYPHVDRKRLNIVTYYPGASPFEVENSVTIPLEKSLMGLEGIKEYASTSRQGYSHIEILLEEDVRDIEKVKNEIRRSISNVDLPEDILKNPNIWEWKITTFPITEIGIFSKTLPYTILRARAKDLKKKLKELKEIADVDEKNILDREVKIKLDLKKLDENYIAVSEVIQALNLNNVEITGGIYKDGKRDRVITVFSKFRNIQDVENIILRSTFEGNRILLKNIALIEDGYKEEVVRVRYNGRGGVSLYPKKKEQADIIKTMNAVRKVVDQYKSSLKNEDMDFVYLWDMSLDTRNRLKTLEINAVIGFFLVLVILFLFMNFKNAFYTAMGIPFAIAFAMIFLSFFNITINSVSLLGIIVVIGMVVDDAIVISENIFRHRLLGKTWDRAALEGTCEVAFAVMTAVSTTIVAFFPLLTLKGMIGDFSKEIPLIVIFILTGSLLEALFILPNHVAHNMGIPNRAGREHRERDFMLFLQEQYRKILRVILKRRYVLISVFVAAFILAYYLLFSGTVIKYVEFPTEDATAIYLSGRVKGGQNLDFTSRKVEVIESALSRYPKKVVQSYGTDVGEVGYPENFFIVVNLTPPGSRKAKADSIISALRRKIVQSGFFTNIKFEKESGGPPVGRAIEVKIVGNDNEERRKISNAMVAFLSSLKGVRELQRSDEENKKELKILVDHNRAGRLGVSPMAIGQTIRAAMNGTVATYIQLPDETIEYRVLLKDEQKNSLATIPRLNVLNNQNRLIKLAGLVRIIEENTISGIGHYNGDRFTEISADVDKTILTPNEVYAQLNLKYMNFNRDHPGFRLIVAGEAKESEETIHGMIRSAVIAVFLIFCLLILLFRSLSQSLIVLLAIPFSLIGITVCLLVHGMPLSAMALFGLVGLSGVVVNDSIVMIDHINDMRKMAKKKSILDLIVDAAGTRLRPILLTSSTTIAGLLPTAYGIGGSDPLIVPTTLVMAWGLIFSSSLTLLLVPSFYYIECGFRNWLTGLVQRTKKTVFRIPLLLLCLLLFLGMRPLSSAGEQVLSLNEFINNSVRNNPKIFRELEKIRKAEAQEYQSKAVHDVLLDVHYYRIIDRPFSDYTAESIREQKTHNGGVSLSWIAPYLGTRLQARMDLYQNSVALNPASFLPFSSIDYFNPEVSVELSQPLLKNWLGLLDRYPVRQAELNRLLTSKAVEESVESLMAGLYTLYFDWYLLYRQFKTYSTNVVNSQVLLSQVTGKYRDGLADEADLSRVRVMNIEYKKARDTVESRFGSISREIYRWNTGKEDALSGMNLIPEESPPVRDVAFGDFRIGETRQVRILELGKELLRLSLQKEKNELLPGLDFIFSYKAANYTVDSSKILSDFNYDNYTVGLKLSFPVGNCLASGKVDEVRSELKAWDEDFRSFKIEMSDSYDKLSEILRMYRKILVYDEDLIRQYRIQVREEERKYRQGRSDLYFIIQNKNNLLNAELTFLSDSVEYRKFVIQFLALTDRLNDAGK